MRDGLLPILSCAEFAAAERVWLTEHPRGEAMLMRRAFKAIADETRALLGRRPRSTLVLAGKGKNGADAILAALTLGGKISIVLAQGNPVGALPCKALAAARRRGAHILHWNAQRPLDLPNAELVLDGILGAGFVPPLDASLRALLRRSENHTGVRIAVDVPSGVGDETASPCFRADLTVSIGCLKSPLLRPAVAKRAGRIRVADIGLPLALGEARCATRDILDALRAPRSARTEKRAQGRILIVGGSDVMPGAVVMNTEAALRAGAGLVTVAAPQSLQAKAALALPEAMWIPVKSGLPTRAAVLASTVDTVLIGSGLGVTGMTLARTTARRVRGVAILDADALRPEVIRATRSAKTCVLLPHAGEFLRIAGKTASPEAARHLARKLGVIVVLKGPLTCVTDGQTVTHIPLGGPILARGGSGDLLAGIVAATVARRESLRLSVLDAVIVAVAWHGAAADWLAHREGETAVRTTQLLAGLSPTLRQR